MRFLVVDTETGGLDARTCGLTELSAVVAEVAPGWSDPPHIVDKFSTLIHPVEGLEYAPEALRIQGRTLADLEAGRTEDRALDGFGRWAAHHFPGSHKPHPWGWNIGFDVEFLRAAYARVERPYPLGGCYVDGMAVFRALGAVGHHRSHRARLDDAMRVYGVQMDPTERHTAIGDALATVMVIARMGAAMRTGVACQTPQPPIS